jgi:hypothetical protein
MHPGESAAAQWVKDFFSTIYYRFLKKNKLLDLDKINFCIKMDFQGLRTHTN